MAGEFIHVRNAASSLGPDDPGATANQDALPVAAPGGDWTLYRTRTLVDFTIWAYSQDDDENPVDRWWSQMYPIIGVEAVSAVEAQPTGSLPQGGEEGTDWVVWEQLQSYADTDVKSDGGFQRQSRIWRLSAGICDSKARRRAAVGEQLTILLAWEWNDPDSLINRSHSSFDTVYDLEVRWSVDNFFRPVTE